MEEHALRLLWALPLVLAIGVAALVALKRLGVGVGAEGGPRASDSAVPSLVSTTRLSEHTTALVLSVEGRRYLVIESSASIGVQPLDASPAAATRAFARAPARRWGVELS